MYKYSYLLISFFSLTFSGLINQSNGQQEIVHVIEFKGNATIPDNILIQKMTLHPSCPFKRSIFSLPVLIEDITNLEHFYRSKGYLDVFISIDTLISNENKKTVKIVLNVFEGPLYIVNTVLFAGSYYFNPIQLHHFPIIKKGSPFDSSMYDSSMKVIRDSLASHGFMFATVQNSYKVLSNSYKVLVTYTIDKGPLVFAGDIEYQGLEKVSESIVNRELTIKPDEIVTLNNVSLSIRNILMTGLFDRVNIGPEDTSSGSYETDSVVSPILIVVRERDMVGVSASGGYTSETGLYVTLGLTFRNIFNLGHSLLLDGNISINNIGAELQYVYPWFVNTPVIANFKSFYRYRREETFDGIFYGASTAFNGNANKKTRFQILSRYENNSNFKPAPAIPDTLSVNNSATLSLGFTLGTMYRLYDSMYTSGIFYTLKSEIAGPGLSWSNQFVKVSIDLRTLSRAFKHSTVTSSLFLGGIKGYGAHKEHVSEPELFFEGRNDVPFLRGYNPEEISPTVNGEQAGGEVAFISTPLELRFPLFLWFSGVVFIDAGKIWKTFDMFNLNELHWSIGPGLRFTVSSFSAQIDYGIQLNNGKNVKGQFHFNAGLPF